MATCTSGCGRGDGVGGDGGAAAAIAAGDESLASGDFGVADARSLADAESSCGDLRVDDDDTTGGDDGEALAIVRCWCCMALRKARLFVWAAAVATSLWSRCSNGDTGDATECRD